MRSTFFLVSVAMILLSVFDGGTVVADDVLDRQVNDVYTPAGDVVLIVPELIAQLEIPAGLELGVYNRMPRCDPNDPLREFRDYDRVPPDRVVAAFERANMSVWQVLDAFCATRNDLTWERRNGIVHIMRRGQADPLLKQVLSLVLPSFKVQQLADTGDANPPAVPVTDFGVVIGKLGDAIEPIVEPLPLGTVWCGEHAKGEPVFSARVDFLDGQFMIDMPNVTVDSALDAIISGHATWVWLAYETGADGDNDDHALVVTNWSPARRNLTMAQLVANLDRDNADPTGYVDVVTRANDAQREIQRRHHYDPAAVRAALADGNAVGKMLAYANKWAGYDQIQWLFSLHDLTLSTSIRQQVLAIADADKRWETIATAFPTPFFHNFAQDYLPLWQDLAANDPDPRVRREANENIEMYQGMVQNSIPSRDY
jgi:hypothetical protein